jgi:parvulin-like peptidyl-prolyl cis-trans isomerase-like protein
VRKWKKGTRIKSAWQNLIQKIDDGEDFATLAKEFSDDHSNRLGGDIGYIYYQMKEQAFADAAFSLRVGEYTKKPVRTERGVYIIKVEDQVEVDEKNIENRISDLNNARSLKNRLSFFAVKRYEVGLEKAEDADVFYKKLVEEGTPEKVIFTVSDNDFTIGDFDEALSEPGDNNKTECDIFRSKLSLNEALLLRDAFSREIHKEPAFTKTWNTMRRSALARKYKNAVVLSISNIEISDEEIEMERASLKDAKKGEFSRDVIVKILTGRKRFAKKLEYEEGILTKNEFTIM